MSNFDWRPMHLDDVPSVVTIAAIGFPDHFEARACFEERLALFPNGCFVLGSADAVKGYLIAYPWPLGSIPPLDSLLEALPAKQSALYLHDLALLPEVAGLGHAREIVDRLVADAVVLGIATIALVSVNDSRVFWQAMGFSPVSDDLVIARKLQSYGENSVYMVRKSKP